MTDSHHSDTPVHIRPPSPRADPSAATINPFASFPSFFPLTKKDHELIRLYGNDSATHLYTPANARAYSRVRDILLGQSLKSPHTLQILIALSGRLLGHLQRTNQDSAAGFYHSRSISTLHRHLRQHPTDTSDDIATSVAFHAIYDFYFSPPERKNRAMMHWQSCVLLIRNTGGQSSFAGNPKLRLLLTWWDYTFVSYQSNDWNFHFTKSSPLQEADPSIHLRASCEEFITFLRNVEHLSLVQKRSSSQQFPWRHNVFKLGTNLHNLLSDPAPFVTSINHRIQLIAHLGSLLSIDTAIWDYRHDTALTERYLTILGVKVVEMDLDIHPCPETMCQILIDGTYVAEEGPALRRREGGRPWFVGRMLKVAKRLRNRSRQGLSDALFHFLTLEGGEGSTSTIFGGDNVLEALRREVLAAPLECDAPPFAGL